MIPVAYAFQAMKFCQVALPRASVVVNTIQAADGSRNLKVPSISSFAVGTLAAEPIPILPAAPYIQFPIES